MIFGRHIAQPLKNNAALVQNIQLKFRCSPGDVCGRCNGRDILYHPLVSYLYLHGQLQQIRIENVIFFHIHIPPCPNKFLTMFGFQGAPPRFHRAAACSVVQGQLPSRLGHSPPHAGHACRDVEHVRGLSGRPLLLGCISITHFRLIVQWFFKKSFTRRAARHLWLVLLIFIINHYVGH